MLAVIPPKELITFDELRDLFYDTNAKLWVYLSPLRLNDIISDGTYTIIYNERSDKYEIRYVDDNKILFTSSQSHVEWYDRQLRDKRFAHEPDPYDTCGYKTLYITYKLLVELVDRFNACSYIEECIVEKYIVG